MHNLEPNTTETAWTPEQEKALFAVDALLKGKFPAYVIAVSMSYNPHTPGSVAVLADGTPKAVKALGQVIIKQAPDVLNFISVLRKVQAEADPTEIGQAPEKPEDN